MSLSAKLFHFLFLPQTAAAVVDKSPNLCAKFRETSKNAVVFSFVFTGLLELYMQVLLLSDIRGKEKFYYMIDYLKTTLYH